MTMPRNWGFDTRLSRAGAAEILHRGDDSGAGKRAPLWGRKRGGDGGILVSCEALRLGMGASHRLARLTRIFRLDFASCSWCLSVSAKRSASILRGAVNLSVTESPAILSSGRPPYRAHSPGLRPTQQRDRGFSFQGRSCDDLTKRMPTRRFPPPWLLFRRTQAAKLMNR